MLRVRFEPTIPVFEQAKTVHALDRAATVIGSEEGYSCEILANVLLSITFVYSTQSFRSEVTARVEYCEFR
jgi:hypothetical protein